MIDRRHFERTVALANRKGGVGKTALAANLAWYAANDDLYQPRVLVIDLDAQANISVEFGCRNHPGVGFDPTGEWGAGHQLRTSLTEGAPLQPVRDIRPRIDLLTADPTWFNDPPVPPGSGWDALASPLTQIAGEYELIVIDTPPSRYDALMWALGTARYVVFPFRTDAASIDGLPNMFGDVVTAREFNPNIEVLSLVGLADSRAQKATKEGLERVQALGFAPELVCNQIVPLIQTPADYARNRGILPVEALQSAGEGKPWWWYRKHGKPIPFAPGQESLVKLVEAHARVASDVMNRIVQREEEDSND